MLLKKWEDLPEELRNDSVKEYYEVLKHKKLSLLLKRIFDFIVALVLVILLSPILIILSVIIKLDSKGPIIFKQERITKYNRAFKVYKFRTMVDNAEKIGAQVTSDNDSRITKIGSKLRGSRLDELPQLFNIIEGTMSFVGTRPEVPRYVAHYSEEMMATLLLPAGVTSRASIEFKDEAELLKDAIDVDKVYVESVLPKKMKYNLHEIKKFSLTGQLKTMLDTLLAVIR